jgi:hypothetical protein
MSTNTSELISLSFEEGTSVDNIGFTYLGGVDRFFVAYSDEMDPGHFVLQSYDSKFIEEPLGASLMYNESWTL